MIPRLSTLALSPALVMLLVIVACASKPATEGAKKNIPQTWALGATLWFQSSGEARALQYQAYNLARLMLEKDLRTHKKGKPRAVIADIDETLLDNGPFEAAEVLGETSFPEGWGKWVASEKAKAIPGAKEFLDFAQGHGVKIFYVTNRGEESKSATIENLRKVRFPGVSAETVICRKDSWNKEERRKSIREGYRVVLLLGDDLNDFAPQFLDKSLAERAALVDADSAKWGSEYIVLPNPIYGDWLKAVHGWRHGLSPEEEAKLREQALEAFH